MRWSLFDIQHGAVAVCQQTRLHPRAGAMWTPRALILPEASRDRAWAEYVVHDLSVTEPIDDTVWWPAGATRAFARPDDRDLTPLGR